MWRFGKSEHKEIWDEAIQWPIGDIAAADKIRNICRSAGDSAERIGGVAGPADNKKPNNKKRRDNEGENDTERYQRAAKTAMEIAMKISDDLMRDSAIREILDLCLKANDTRTAQILFRAIQAASIREDVLNEHPKLKQ
jgi:hypothetical protein